jgi:NADH-quinone oxidoreductase subunit I
MSAPVETQPVVESQPVVVVPVVGTPIVEAGVTAPELRKSRVTRVRREYWNAPTMTWWERAYLPEVLRGLSITTGIFLRNMWRWVTGRRGALTSYYPEEKRADFAPANRGKHILTQRPDGSPQCIACNMCATVCPAKVIEIEAGFDENDPAHPKFPIRFEIDYSRCVFCGLCIEACPEDAIRMEPDVPQLASPDRYNMWLTMDHMLTWRPKQDVLKPYPPRPLPVIQPDAAPRGPGPSTH